MKEETTEGKGKDPIEQLIHDSCKPYGGFLKMFHDGGGTMLFNTWKKSIEDFASLRVSEAVKEKDDEIDTWEVTAKLQAKIHHQDRAEIKRLNKEKELAQEYWLKSRKKRQEKIHHLKAELESQRQIAGNLANEIELFLSFGGKEYLERGLEDYLKQNSKK